MSDRAGRSIVGRFIGLPPDRVAASVSLVAEFALRLIAGLSAALLLVPSRQVPPAFFRTLSWVAMGLGVLTAVDSFANGGSTTQCGGAIVLVVLGYLGSISWGIGLPRLGAPLTALQAAISAALLLLAASPASNQLDLAAGLGSGFFLGSLLVAMLLGHHYLTAPAMTTTPLVRATAVAGCALAIRAALAIAALVAVRPGAGSWLLLLMRWVFGLIVPTVGLVLTWRTARIRSTQSATGILYATIVLALLGELASQVLERSTGVAY